MAVELPSPGFVRRRLSHERDPVFAFSVLDEVVAVQLAECFVETHDVSRELQSLGTQGYPEHPERRRALRRAHLVERHSLPEVDVLVRPLPPLDIVHGKHRPAALLGAERREECSRGGANRRGRDARRADREEVWNDGAVGRNPLEWFLEPGAFHARAELAGPLSIRLAIGSLGGDRHGKGCQDRREQVQAWMHFHRPLPL
jgi:hypothetical protein